jgi:hypothetical protein
MSREPDFDTGTYVLVMTRKYATSDNTWSRAFGPFTTRGKANSFKQKQIRHMLAEYYTQERIDREFKWQIVQLWTPK